MPMFKKKTIPKKALKKASTKMSKKVCTIPGCGCPASMKHMSSLQKQRRASLKKPINKNIPIKKYQTNIVDTRPKNDLLSTLSLQSPLEVVKSLTASSEDSTFKSKNLISKLQRGVLLEAQTKHYDDLECYFEEHNIDLGSLDMLYTQ